MGKFKTLKVKDHDLYNLIQKEENRQKFSLNLIASENIILENVKECFNSCLNNKYSEGYVNNRYYAGTINIDEIEKLAIKRCLKAFNLNETIWGVNVQSYSGSIANFEIYNALCNPHDKIMGLNLPDGGHLSHGYKTPTKFISATSKYFSSISYNVNSDGFIDYEDLENKALEFKPKIIIAGTSAYSRLIDYKKIKEVCEKINCYLLADISHIAGLVVTNLIPGPFEYADIVMTTTHKTLRGPRGAIIMFKKELESKINYSVFPSMQGGPHNSTIAGIAALMKETKTEKYILYQMQILTNAKVMSNELKSKQYKILTNDTDTHMIIIDLSDKGINGKEAEYILEKCNIICNKNFIYKDKLPCEPSGIRLGVSFITAQNYDAIDMVKICNFIDEGIIITQKYVKNNHIISNSIKFLIENLNIKIQEFIFNNTKIYF